MINIKVSTVAPEWDWIRQTPKNDGVWENCRFVFDQQTKTCDYWIVYENILQQETALCPAQNKILLTGEPKSIKTYHPKFLAQFDMIISCHTNLKHPNVLVSHPSLPWMIGYQPPEKTFTKSYTELTKNEKPTKTKLISVICSNKTHTRGHRKRLDFVKKLQEHFGDYIDFYGRGFIPIQDKWDAIAPYKYHIALENSAYNHYWTEKLTDAFLADSYPIYYGCPNIKDYFPADSLTKIDINKPEESFLVIEQVIKNNSYEKSIATQKQAKDLVLNKYNFFPRMVKLCQEEIKEKREITLYSQDYFWKQDPIYKKVIRKIFYVAPSNTP
ncbi:hypothetical protein KAT92_01490 [Candidatus Babeliales bacterium]|nr:hypothetical protein [Candidatus Babeliales bacterium]